MKSIVHITSILLFILFCLVGCQLTKKGSSAVPAYLKMTVLDGGQMNLNLAYYSTDSSYVGQRKDIANPVFIIEHPKGRMIWDTGLPDALADMSEEELANISPLATYKMSEKLIDQLTEMGLTPDDFDYLVFSHTHADHAGNGNHFANSTWIVSQEELDFAFSKHSERASPFYAKLKEAKKKIIKGKHDVFGDGKVVIYPFPGHTPGHSALYLDFDARKNILLTGDLYHFQQQRAFMRTPVYNTDIPQTIASMKAFEKLVKELDAEVFIQHDADSYKRLPHYPNYWN